MSFQQAHRHKLAKPLDVCHLAQPAGPLSISLSHPNDPVLLQVQILQVDQRRQHVHVSELVVAQAESSQLRERLQALQKQG